MAYPQRLAIQLPFGELRRVCPSGNGQMVRRRAQVLADGHDVHTDRGKIEQQARYLICRLAKAEHEAGLGGHTSGFRSREHRQAAGIPRARAHRSLQTGDSFDVVVEHVGAAGAFGEQHAERRVVALRITDQSLDGGAGSCHADRFDARRNVRKTAITEVVARHHRQHRMRKVHLADSGRDPLRFIGGRCQWFLRVDQAEATRPGAALAQDHERRCAVRPAVTEIGAAGLLTHRHQSVVAHGLFQRQHLGADRHLRAQPLRLAGRDRQTVGDTGLLKSRRRALTGCDSDTVLRRMTHDAAWPVAARERCQIVWPRLPRNVLTLETAAAP